MNKHWPLSDDLKTQLPEKLQPQLLETQDNCLTFRLHKKEHQIGDVLNAVRDAGLNIIDLNTEETGLEEVFLGLTDAQLHVGKETVK